MKITPLGGAPTTGFVSDTNRPMTIIDLAVKLERSERTIRRWIADYGIAPVGRIGREHVYWESDMLSSRRDTRRNRLKGLRCAQSSRVA
jgi:hypothetical protein